MYLVNESSKLESVNRVHEIGEKSHSLLDHPRNCKPELLFINHFSLAFVLSLNLTELSDLKYQKVLCSH